MAGKPPHHEQEIGGRRSEARQELFLAPSPLEGASGAQERFSEPRSGDLCPHCRVGRLDYDGLLNLTCPACGYAVGGCFT